ncbi:hypothetical protein [Cecembia calidifontis]|uniref:Uncharacterized protein n=1 Tax=Cecembia calidifontis TaxID=1187080 RepID=A0A4Q7P852_9BACT|nr:hypothetical protein [Cecembia calidifontis]RZS96333.1 hypothetical protein BC751_1902 [Cecembia calidifontis]
MLRTASKSVYQVKMEEARKTKSQFTQKWKKRPLILSLDYSMSKKLRNGVILRLKSLNDEKWRSVAG